MLVRYAIIAPDGTGSIAVRAIAFFGLAVQDVAAVVDGEAARVELTTTDGGLEGRAVTASALPPDRMIAVDLRYRVPRALVRDGDRIDVRVPVLLLEAAPASSGEGFFDAELITPRGVTLTESFPTVRVVRTTDAVNERFTSTLQVVPALLRWRVTAGPAPRLSFAAAVDLGILVLIAVLAVIAGRALRKKT